MIMDNNVPVTIENIDELMGQVKTDDSLPDKPAKRKWGRPTAWTDEVNDKIKNAFLFGFNNIEACAFAEISEETLYKRLGEDEDFSKKVKLWKQNPFLKAKATVYGKLNEPDTAKWYLERRRKDEFGTRTEVTGAEGKDLIPSLIEKLDKTDYGKLAEQAKRQMVALKPPVQNKE